MEEELMHELSAAYALDVLDADEEHAFESHLADCPRCQADLAAFADAAASLAYAAPAVRRPAALRDRILAEAAQDHAPAVRLQLRGIHVLATAAALAACAAIGFGSWAAYMHSQLSRGVALRALPLRGAQGSLVISRNGDAALVVSGLTPAPAGSTYELWVLRGNAAQPAGLFTARTATTSVDLTRHLTSGERIAVTVEPAGGSAKPTHAPLFTSASD